jgi:endonuclease YncB( thermonuclease family)
MTAPLFLYPLRKNTYRVIDGDTVEVLLDRGWICWKRTSLRLAGVNAPECRTQRKLEKQAGLAVKALVTAWCAARVSGEKQLYATSDMRPKYAGRTVGRIWACEDPLVQRECLNDYLLEAGVVKEYQGGRRSWTDAELEAVLVKCVKVQDSEFGVG